MIQFNLLPDVKKEYVKTRRTKRLISTIAILSSVVSVVIVIVMFSIVNIGQKGHIDRLSADISSAASEIQATDNLDTVLTIQNQLSILPELHTAKPETSRVFDYITFVAPETVKVTTLDLSVPNSSMSIAGSADSIATINKLVDNIKAVTFSIVGSEEGGEEISSKPFSAVITTLGADNETATFQINFAFDPVIFDNTNEIIMSIGSQSITTDEGATNNGN